MNPFLYLKAAADPDLINNEGKKLSTVARDPDVLVILKKWGIISGLSSYNDEKEMTIYIGIFFLGFENGFHAEEYQNNDSEED